MPAIPKHQPILSFDKTLPEKKLADIRDNLSAIVLAEKHLWLGGDEGTQIERLTRSADGNFAEHRRFDLGGFLSLPADEKSEIDIEGLDFDGGALFVVGSHSLKRKKVDKSKDDVENRKRLADVQGEPNRYTFARVSMTSGGDLEKSGSAQLERDAQGDLLFRALSTDEHLGRACNVPSKENGLDIEGLAVRGNRAFIGLRGPVLRGFAVLLEFEWRETAKGLLRMSSPIKKHLLELGGLGIRELCIMGRDLLILAGPTMDLDGPVVLWRWPKALDKTAESLVSRKDLQQVLEIPFGTGKDAGRDHAEGIALMGSDLMVCYDSPAQGRLFESAPHQTRVDIFAMD